MTEPKEAWQIDTVVRVRTRFDETVDEKNLPTLQSILDMIASRPEQFCVGSTNRVRMQIKDRTVDLLVQMDMVVSCNGEPQVTAAAPTEAEMLEAIEVDPPAPSIVVPDQFVSTRQQ